MSTQSYQMFFLSFKYSPPAGDLEVLIERSVKKWRIRGGRSCDPKDTPSPPMDQLSPGDSPVNLKKLVKSLYKPTAALPVS